MSADLTHVTLVLFLAFLGGLILQHFRQPRIIGYIIVGALIGPSFLGIQSDDPTLRWLAELGVILLMFMVGLELDIRRFVSLMRPAIGATVLQIVFSLIVMAAIGVFFDWPWQRVIILGFAVSLSSTAVAMTMLRDIGEMNSSSGRLSTAILIAQDIAVVPMLLIINILQDASLTVEDATSTILGLVAIAASLFVIYELQRHPQWIARIERLLSHGHGQATLAGLALCFGAATLTGAVGLSTAYGAFAIGLFLGNVGSVGVSYRHAVAPLHDLLLTVFFLSIGLLLDLGFIMENWLLLGVILLAVLFLKTFGNFMILRILTTPPRTALIMGATLGQIGEFSFVLVALGFSGGFVSQETYQIALATIALSLALSPLSLGAVRHYLHLGAQSV